VARRLTPFGAAAVAIDFAGDFDVGVDVAAAVRVATAVVAARLLAVARAGWSGLPDRRAAADRPARIGRRKAPV
jgi:hypothetical protein